MGLLKLDALDYLRRAQLGLHELVYGYLVGKRLYGRLRLSLCVRLFGLLLFKLSLDGVHLGLELLIDLLGVYSRKERLG